MVNEKVRHPSGKRLIKNNQQCARYGHHAVVCLLCRWHLEMAGRDWFLRSPLFPDQHIITQTLVPMGKEVQSQLKWLQRDCRVPVSGLGSAKEPTGKQTDSIRGSIKSLASKILATRTFLFFPPQKTKKQNTF